MTKTVPISNRKDKEQILWFLQKEGQMLLPILELVATSRIALDKVIDVTGRAVIEPLLELSAERLAGPKQRGKAGEEIRWHGRQSDMVLRWLASAFLDAEKTFQRIQGYRDLWILDAALDEPTETKRDSRKEVAEHCWVSAAPKVSTTNGTSPSQNHEILREKCFEEYLRTTEPFTFPSF